MAVEKFFKNRYEEVDHDDYGDVYESDQHQNSVKGDKPSGSEKGICDKANGLIADRMASGHLAETVTVVASMHLYNFLSNGTPSDEDLSREIAKMDRLSKIEEIYSKPNNPLPTIGIEIEIPGRWLDFEKVEILNGLKVPNRQELVGGGYLWEVRPDFSYSPLIQSRILQELVVMGAVPIERDKDGVLHIPKNEILSLHLNYALPVKGGAETVNIYESEDLNYLSDFITYAYVSPERLSLKKTGWSFDVKLNNVKPSKKMGKEIVGERGEGEVLLARVEFRATEFRDYTTFRLLAETQEIMAAYMSFLKQRHQMKLSEDETYLAELWPKFLGEIKQLFKNNDVDLNLVDNNREKAIYILKNNPDFKKACRALMRDYSRVIHRRVFLKS